MKSLLYLVGLILAGLAAAGLLAYQSAASSLVQAAQEGEVIFQQKCASCHTIGGGRLVGPDLEGAAARRELSWLRSFIANPDELIDSGDPQAVQLLAEYNNLRMPNMGLSEAEVAAVIAFLEAPSGGEPAAGQPPAGQPLPVPQGSLQAGQALFTGEARLENGGTACIACHTATGANTLAGGSLGPDLTHVMQRYGEAGLAGNLNQIVFPTMQGPFLNRPLTPQEQADLIAFFRWSDTQAAPPAAAPALLMLGVGAAGALGLFGLLAVLRSRQSESPAARLRRRPPPGRNISDRPRRPEPDRR